MMTNRLGMLSSVLVVMVGCGPAVMHGKLEVIAPASIGAVGSVVQLQARVISPSGALMDVSHEVAWSVSDTRLGAIGNAGQLSLLAPGTVSVIASYGAQKVATKIIARAEKLPTLQLLPNVERLNVGVRQQFLLFAGFEDGRQQDLTEQATWTFQGGLIAADARGSAIATLAGSALVRASFDGREVETQLTIQPAADVGFRIEMASGLRMGDKARLALISTYADGSTEDVAQLATWTSSHPNTAQIEIVNGEPSLHALQAGFTSVTATVNGIKTVVAVSVLGKAISKLEFDVSIVDLAKGAQTKIDVFARYSDGERAHITAGMTFVSAAPFVFTVDSSGVVTAKEQGDSHLWATFQGTTAILDIHVGAARMVGLKPSVTSMRLAPGQALEVKIIGTLSDGSTVDLTPTATALGNGLTSSKLGNPLLVIAEADVQGTETVMVQAGGMETAIVIDVSREPLEEIRLTKDWRNGPAMVATARWSDGLEMDVTELARWSADIKSVASVSDLAGTRGELSFSTVGNATISATIGKLTGQFVFSAPPPSAD